MATDMIDAIHNVRVVDPHLTTGGQPTEAQLAAVAAANYDVVINLALHDDPRYSLKDEAGLVASLGMTYLHIPVIFSAPQPNKLAQFCDAMAAHQGKKMFVHCAANYRVSAFVGLYRVLRQGWDNDRAFALMHELWQPDETWQHFIDAALLQGKSKQT